MLNLLPRSLFDKFTSVMKAKSSEMKEKWTDYINQTPIDRFRGMTLLDTEDPDDDPGNLTL